MWYFDVGKFTVGRVTPNGTITEFAVPGVGAGSEGITGAPDGNIWMVARASAPQPDSILKISPQGVVTNFPLAGAFGPEGITWGPDGNIWFTEFCCAVGRMTPSGQVTEFPLPRPNRGPRGIVTGPDHNLWIAEDAAIARMTTAGHLTEYPLGGTATEPLQPFNIVLGSDGNLWFSESDRIGRITPAGVVTHFPVQGYGASGLAVGADGNLWFTSTYANVVGRMSPTGAFRLFQLPNPAAQPIGIAAGSDGRMWFTEAGISKIASIGVAVPETTLSARVLNFGSGTGPAMHVAISNTGDGALRVATATVGGPDRALFHIMGDTCSGRTVGVGSQCGIDVAISPEHGTGFIAAYMGVVDNATGSPHFVSLVGRLPDCRLPLYAYSSGQGQLRSSWTTVTSTFLNPSTGREVNDPGGSFVFDGTRFRSLMKPVLYGGLDASYDQAAKRWVPAPTEAVSPDGARYAYVEYGQGAPVNQIHVADVATGSDRVLTIPTGDWAIVRFAREGIYVDQRFEGIGPGLTLVNPDSGAVQPVFSDSPVWAVSGHVAWIGARDATDPLPEQGGISRAFNEIQSRDLKTSAITTWIYRSGARLNPITATEGSVLVSGYDHKGQYVWFVGAPGHAELISGPELADLQPYAPFGLGATSGRIDSYGTWLGTGDGLYLWTHRTGPILVADTGANPAGPCA